MAAEPASQPAAKPARTITGTLDAIDPAAGRLTIGWKHQGQAMPFMAKLSPDAEILIDGKSAKPADLKIGDRVAAVGKVGQDAAFAVSKLQVTRSAASAPASAPAAGDAKVDAILTRLEKKGDQVRNIQSQITFIKTDPVLEDKQVFKGILRFMQDKPNPRFLIRFDKFIQEGVEQNKQEYHIFDGEYYIEAREKTRTIVRRQIVRPGEQINVFRIGQGPFPLPFGQKKSEILEYFDVQLVPPQATDPPNTDHLKCTPKPDTDMARKYGEVHFYIDRTLDLPVSVRTVEKTENVEVKAEFPADTIQVNRDLGAGALNLPELPGYHTDVIPLDGPAAGK